MSILLNCRGRIGKLELTILIAGHLAILSCAMGIWNRGSGGYKEMMDDLLVPCQSACANEL